MENEYHIFRNILERSALQAVRRQIALLLVYSMLASQVFPAFASGDLGVGNHPDAVTLTASSSNQQVPQDHSYDNSSITDRKTDGYDTTAVSGTVTFMGDSAADFQVDHLRLCVNGVVDHGVTFTLDKTGTIAPTASGSDAADMVWLLNDLDEGAAKLNEISDPNGITTWSYISAEVPAYDEEGEPYVFGIVDLTYPTATASNMLFYAEADHTLVDGDGEWGMSARNLVYVETKTISGVYKDTTLEPMDKASFSLVVSTEDDVDLKYADLADGQLDLDSGLWRIEDAMVCNPATGQPILWRAQVLGDGTETEFTYHNIGVHKSETEYLYAGGTILRERHTFAAQGLIQWDDADNWHGKRPQDLSFVRVVDEKRKDITEQITLDMRTVSGSEWEYRIDGLEAGEQYTLLYKLPYYDAEEQHLTSDGNETLTILEPVQAVLQSQNYLGVITWDTIHSMFAPSGSVDFLSVYYGDKDVTEHVDFKLTVNPQNRSQWYYELSGLVTGADYTVVVAAPEGYYSNLASFDIKAKRGLDRAGLFMLPELSLRAAEYVTITVTNETHGWTGSTNPIFTYQLMADGVPYTGSYTITDENDIETVVDGATFTVPANKQVTLTFLKSGAVTIENVTSNPALAFLGQKTSADDFIMYHTATKREYVHINWNDDNNDTNERVEFDKLQDEGLWLQFWLGNDPSEEGEWITLTPGNLGELGLSSSWGFFGEMTGNDKQSVEWKLSTDLLPAYILDEFGIPVKANYKVTAADVDGYTKNAKSEPESAGSYSAWQVSYTLIKTFTAHVQWLDAGEDNSVRMKPNDWLGTLKFYRKSANPKQTEAELLSLAETGLTFDQVYGEADKSWTITADGLPAYDEAGFLYQYYVVQDNSMLTTDSNNTLLNDFNPDSLKYESAYDNAGNYLHETESCCEGGTIKNTLTAQISFSGKKLWLDDGHEAERPEITAYLWRYVKGKEPGTAAQVKGGRVSVPRIIYDPEGAAIEFSADFAADELPAFNAQGEEYIYFVWENLNQISNYEAIAENNEERFHEFNIELPPADYLLNGGILQNRRVGSTTTAITKLWNAKAIHGFMASITMTLQRRVPTSPDVSDWQSVDTQKHIFQVENPDLEFEFITDSKGNYYPKYDDEGREYEYRIVETNVTIGEESRDVDPPADGVQEVSYEVGPYKFICSYPGDGTIVNRLDDYITYDIEKTWHLYTPNGQTRRDEPEHDALHFHLWRNGQDICHEFDQNISKGQPHGGHFVLTKNDAVNGNIMKWHKVLMNGNQELKLPRYDETGAEYRYSITEDPVYSDVSDKNYYVDINYEFDETKLRAEAKVSNSDWPATTVPIYVSKEWLDDSDKLHRQPVTVELWYQNQYLQRLVLNEKNNWHRWFSVPKTENPDDQYKDYTVVETKIGDDTAVIDTDGNKRIKAHNHSYIVTETGAGNTWTVTNRRVGTIKLSVIKEWFVDNLEFDGGYQAEFQIIQTLGEESKPLYEPFILGAEHYNETDKVMKYTYPTLLPKYDDMGVIYSYTIKETRINIPDEDGSAHWYPVADGKIAVDSDTWLAEVELAEYISSESRTDDEMIFQATNTRSGTIDLQFYKVWQDNNELDAGASRPDIYLKLWRTAGTGSNEKTEYLQALSAEWIKDQDDYVWSCSFGAMSRYDDEGRLYTYYAEEGMTGGSGEKWESVYYNKYASASNSLDEPSTEQWMTSGGAVVNLRKEDITVKGRKVWLEMDGVRGGDYPELIIYLSRRVLDRESGELKPDISLPAEPVMAEDAQGQLQPLFYELKVVDGIYQSNYEFDGLPQYDDSGQRIYYYVSEAFANPDIDALGIYESEGGGTNFVFTNKFIGDEKLEVHVEKKWKVANSDVAMPDNAKPVEVEFDLYRVMRRNDQTIHERYDNKTLAVADGDVSVAFEKCSQYAPNGTPYEYYLKEHLVDQTEPVPGYKISMETSDGTPIENGHLDIDMTGVKKTVSIVITNEYTGGGIVEIKGTKVWENDDWVNADTGEKDKFRPDFDKAETAIALTLTRKASSVVEPLNDIKVSWTEDPMDENIWHFTITAKDENARQFYRYATTGVEYIYSVKEARLVGYEEPVYSVKNTVDKDSGIKTVDTTITNALELIEVKMEKIWQDEDNLYVTRPLNLKADIQRSTTGQNETDFSNYKKDISFAVGAPIGNTRTYLIGKFPRYQVDMNAVSGTPENARPYYYRVVEAQVEYYKAPTHVTAPDGDQAGTFKTTVTNELDAVTTTIQATKVWADFNDKDGLRPGKIKLTLLREGVEVETAILDGSPEEHEQNGEEDGVWHVTWKHYPPGNYTVVETTEDDQNLNEPTLKFYTSTASSSDADGNLTYTFTNSHTPIENVTVTFVKTWDDWNNCWGARPDKLAVTLYRQLGEQGPIEEVAGYVDYDIYEESDNGNTYTYTFRGLEYAREQVPYTYFVKEPVLTLYNSTATESARTSSKFTPVVNGVDDDKLDGEVKLLNTAERITFILKKSWQGDEKNAYGTRPETITFALFRRLKGTAVWEEVNDNSAGIMRKTLTLTQLNNGFDWDDIPITDQALQVTPYEYQVREVSLNYAGNVVDQVTWNEEGTIGTSHSYKTTVSAAVIESGEIITVTNTLISDGKITVTKVWNDNNNQDGQRPSEARVQLYQREGQSGAEKTVDKEYSLGRSHNAVHTWHNLPKTAPGGQPYYYQVKEVTDTAGSGYEEPVYTIGDQICDIYRPTDIESTVSVQIENKYLPKTMSLTVNKEWAGDSQNPDLRPPNINYQLTWSIDEGNSWHKYAVLPVQTGEANPDQYSVMWEGLPVRLQADQQVDPENTTSQSVWYQVTEENITTPAVYTASYDHHNGAEIYTEGDLTGSCSRTVTVTNTLTEKTRFTVNKIWADQLPGYSRTDELNEIELKLWRKTAKSSTPEYVSTKQFSVEQANCVFDNLVKYDDNGNRYQYFAEETALITNGDERILVQAGKAGGYIVTATASNAEAMTITNTLQTRSIKVEKVWADSDNQDGIRPTSIELELRYDNKSYTNADDIAKAKKKLTQADGWTNTWNDYPAVHANGDAFKYTVYEKDIADYSKNITTSEQEADSIIVTNSHTPLKTSVTIIKHWAGEEHDWVTAERPDSIQVQLYRKIGNAPVEKVGEPQTIGANKGWTYTWDDLPMYANPTYGQNPPGDSHRIYYYADEVVEVTGDDQYGYDISTSSNAANPEDLSKINVSITNTLKTTRVTIEKEWIDQGNEHRRPGTAIFRLERSVTGGEPWTQAGPLLEMTVASDKPLTTLQLTGLPQRSNDNKAYTYRAVEVKADHYDEELGKVAGYTINYDDHFAKGVLAGSLRIKNVLETVSLSGTKTWLDGSYKDIIRPKDLTLILKANTETAAENGTHLCNWTNKETDEWTYTYNNLPKYDTQNDEIIYYVEEAVPFGYEESYDSMHTNIINTLNTRIISGTKVWGDQNNRYGLRPESIELIVKVNNHPLDQQPNSEHIIWEKPEGSNTWNWTITGLPDKDKDDIPVVYTVEEKQISGYLTNQNGYDLTNTQKTGILCVTNHQTGGPVTEFAYLVELELNGVWVPYQGTYIVYGDDGDLSLPGEDKTTVGSGEIIINGDQKFYLTDLPADISYRVTQQQAADFKQYGKSNLTDKIIHDDVQYAAISNRYYISLNGSKTWNDSSNQFATRPPEIELLVSADKTLLDPQPDQSRVSWIKTGDVWNWSITELPETDETGTLISYSVEEAAVTGYLATQSNYDITNTMKSGSLFVTNHQIGGPDTEFTYNVMVEVNGNFVPYYGKYMIYDKGDDLSAPGTTQTTTADNTIVIKGNQTFCLSDLPDDIAYIVTQRDQENFEQFGHDHVVGSIKHDSNIHAAISDRYHIDLSGTKTWIDRSNQFGTRPDQITLDLYVNGQLLDPQPAPSRILWEKQGDRWYWTIRNQPETDEHGNLLVYTVKEQPVSGYLVTQLNRDIINTLQTGGLSVSKIQDGGSETDFTFRVTITRNHIVYPYRGSYTVMQQDEVLLSSGEVRQTGDGSIILRGGQKFIINDLPAGAGYQVTEDNVSQFKQTAAVNTAGAIVSDTIIEAEVTNTYQKRGGGGSSPGTKPATDPTEAIPKPAPVEPVIPDTTGQIRVPDVTAEVIVTGPDGNPIVQGPVENGMIDTTGWDPGSYQISLYNENDELIGVMYVIIEDQTIALGLVKTGDNRISGLLLGSMMIAAVGAIGITGTRSKCRKRE